MSPTSYRTAPPRVNVGGSYRSPAVRCQPLPSSHASIGQPLEAPAPTGAIGQEAHCTSGWRALAWRAMRIAATLALAVLFSRGASAAPRKTTQPAKLHVSAAARID